MSNPFINNALDMDVVIYKNIDELFEIDKELLFTGDYNMKGGAPVPPAQGEPYPLCTTTTLTDTGRGVPSRAPVPRAVRRIPPRHSQGEPYPLAHTA